MYELWENLGGQVVVFISSFQAQPALVCISEADQGYFCMLAVRRFKVRGAAEGDDLFKPRATFLLPLD